MRTTQGKTVLLIGLLAFLSACAPRALTPEARFLGAEIRGLELAPTPALLLGLRVEFQNPNPFPLPLATFGTRLRVGEVGVPLDLTLPPGRKEETLLVRLTPGEALTTARALLSREGVEVALEGRTLGQNLTFFRTRVAFPVEPPRVRRAGVNFFLENPNPFPLRVEGRLVLTGQSFRVQADLPARGEGRLQVVGFRPGLERGTGRLELTLEVPGFLRMAMALPL
ncbi:hypothetical protein [Thermus thermamylovorans]|uniref:Water stress and hypersensitive response domain-containing protein n=1 Tax=Thermus thermamylovorans TaxID=2509362 RepID=A0A4V2IV55_9DEIN|nr:hypothetical protein [Thermus thermamylovorans]TBH21014.1 hypothetical protein ETP66_04360 [Thermus thermamylovorans]